MEWNDERKLAQKILQMFEKDDRFTVAFDENNLKY